MQQALGRLEHLTFKGNLRDTRFGWLRLTPAYSVHLVADLVERNFRPGMVVLDPFCGTGTTALVCAERGIECDTCDINPFLLWLARVKASRYSEAELEALGHAARGVAKTMLRDNARAAWQPPLHQIEKWWSPGKLSALARGMAAIRRAKDAPAVLDLLKVAFCRTMIEHANVSFGHQSMSFRKASDDAQAAEKVADTWKKCVQEISAAARTRIRKKPHPVLCDARDLRAKLALDRYGCVITSPPYPNRMSYIRELRPYMYWLGYLADGRQAGELDWQAIGGTWGVATSNVASWAPSQPLRVPYPRFDDIVARIAEQSPVLGRYVDKYFHDIVHHCRSLAAVVAPGGTVHYIVGNSKFYDVLLPVERIYAAIFRHVGLEGAHVTTIRKRTSKKELYEFVVSAERPRRARR